MIEDRYFFLVHTLIIERSSNTKAWRFGEFLEDREFFARER